MYEYVKHAEERLFATVDGKAPSSNTGEVADLRAKLAKTEAEYSRLKTAFDTHCLDYSSEAKSFRDREESLQKQLAEANGEISSLNAGNALLVQLAQCFKTGMLGASEQVTDTFRKLGLDGNGQVRMAKVESKVENKVEGEGSSPFKFT